MVAVAKKDIVLKVEKLKKAYGPATIVEGFDLKVAAGEAVALTGRNGAGKSTVLRCLVGADRPDEGTVEVLGVKMKETSPEIRRNVATVIDDLDFFPDLSVVEHLDLLELRDRHPLSLSGGQKQRAARPGRRDPRGGAACSPGRAAALDPVVWSAATPGAGHCLRQAPAPAGPRRTGAAARRRRYRMAWVPPQGGAR